MVEAGRHYLAAVLGENPYIGDVHRTGYTYGGSWRTAVAKADHVRSIPAVGNASLMSFHSTPRRELVAAPGGHLEVDLLNPGVEADAILPDNEEYFAPQIYNLALRGVSNYLSETHRGRRDILHAHHWTSALAIGPANEAGMTTIFTPDMPGPFNLRIGRSCSGARFEIERQAFHEADLVTVNTERELDIVSLLYSKTTIEEAQFRKKTHVIPPGIDASIFNPQEAARRKVEARKRLNIPDSAQSVALTSGRLSVAKNFEALIEAWRGNNNPGQYAVIVTNLANPNDPYLQQLRERIATLPPNSQARVLVRGFQEDPIIPYAAADAYVTVSQLETYGSNLSEAMACGVPIVASNIPEYLGQLGQTKQDPEVIMNAEHLRRLIVPLNQPEPMGEGIAQALEFIREEIADEQTHEALRIMMHQIGSRNSWEQVARRLIELTV